MGATKQSRNDWSFDSGSGHLAHTSGLYSYCYEDSENPTRLICPGPFSSYTDKLNPKQVQTLISEATETLEALYPNRYCLWGAISSKSRESSSTTVAVLGEPFFFEPAPFIRTNALLVNHSRRDSTRQALRREWQWEASSLLACHALGIEFKFTYSEASELECRLVFQDRAQGDLMCRGLTELQLNSLACCAIAVLKSQGAVISNPEGHLRTIY